MKSILDDIVKLTNGNSIKLAVQFKMENVTSEEMLEIRSELIKQKRNALRKKEESL